MRSVCLNKRGKEAAQITRRFPWRERIPILRFAILDDRTGTDEVILVEENADPHVNEVTQCRTGIGGLPNLGNPARNERVQLEFAAFHENTDNQSENGF